MMIKTLLAGTVAALLVPLSGAVPRAGLDMAAPARTVAEDVRSTAYLTMARSFDIGSAEGSAIVSVREVNGPRC